MKFYSTFELEDRSLAIGQRQIDACRLNGIKNYNGSGKNQLKANASGKMAEWAVAYLLGMPLEDGPIGRKDRGWDLLYDIGLTWPLKISVKCSTKPGGRLIHPDPTIYDPLIWDLAIYVLHGADGSYDVVGGMWWDQYSDETVHHLKMMPTADGRGQQCWCVWERQLIPFEQLLPQIVSGVAPTYNKA